VPKVSVHIVTYNSAETIERCLSSLAEQRGVDFKTLVIDNASTDETVQRVEKMGVPIVANSTNLGYSVAHNQAIGGTTSEYVLTLNPDIWLDPNYLQQMVRALDHTPHMGSACGRLLRVEQLGQPPYAIDSTGLFMRRNRRQGLCNESYPLELCPTQPQLIFGPDGAAAFYRRKMLENITVLGEVFDADFFIQKEDVDVCWRAQLLGWQSIYVPEAIGHHIRAFRPGQRYRRTVSKEMRFYAVRNRYLLMLKNEIPSHFLRDLITISVYDFGVLAYIILRERESWSSLMAVFPLARRMLQKRRIIQSSRRVSRRDIQQWFQ
jgi:GT2 family glycosyltransferase